MTSFTGSRRLTVGLTTLLLWGVAAGSALYWGLRATGARGEAVPPAATGAQAVNADADLVARALGAKGAASGAAAAAPDVAGRLALKGVVTYAGHGAALIAVGDKPAKPFRVGDEVESGWSLKSVSPRSAVISSGGRETALNMPPLSERSSAGDAVAATPAVRPSLAPMQTPAAPTPGVRGVPNGLPTGLTSGVPHRSRD